MTERDSAWQRFFEHSKALPAIQQEGHCYITADRLKQHGRREPRLMAKIDTLAERPKAFKEHGLSIFPVRNGEYILFPDPEERTFYRFGDEIEHLPIQQHISTADLLAYDSFPGSQRLSESQAIDFAHLSGLLQHFTQDSQLQLTIRGRAFSGAFHFYPPQNTHRVDVGHVQIEIDAGYESPTAIYLIEAKVGQRGDFNIRQLYYPYLEWKKRSLKRIVPIFLVYTNGKYYLTEFHLTEAFGELYAVRSACYVVDEQPRPQLSLGHLLADLPPAAALSEPAVPYPQADDLDKVLDVVALIGTQEIRVDAASFTTKFTTKAEIAHAFEFDERQGDYYANAGCYLGLLQRQSGGFALTALGAAYLQTRSRALRNEMVVRQLLQRPTYRALLAQLCAENFDLARLTRTQIAETIATHTILGGTTPNRRGQSVRSWLAMLLRNADLQP